MAQRIFISYRHVEPDQALCHSIREFLSGRGHDIFLDIELLVGTEWAEEIERQIRSADFFVVLLSKDSIRSDMVRREVKLAHALLRSERGKPRILPVRLDFDGELPYDLGAYLDPLQYTLWRRNEPGDSVCTALTAAIESGIALPDERASEEEKGDGPRVRALFEVTDGAGAPLPAADPRLVPRLDHESGTVRPDSPFYVRRRADDQMVSQILGEGTTTVVKGPRQIGKSSLLARAFARAKQEGQRAFYLDFQLIDTQRLSSLDKLLRYLCARIGSELNAQGRPKDLWDEDLGPADNATDFLEDAVLAADGSPVALLFDEVDCVFDRPFREPFFALLRAWHNRRATHRVWHRLNLFLAHSTEPYLWIRNPNQSPFNVGLRVQLDDFDLDEVADLDRRHGRILGGDAAVSELLELVGGHPFLVRQALYALSAHRWTLARLRRDAVDERGPFGDHLRHILWSLREADDLRTALRQVLARGSCEDEEAFQRLHAAGLVQGTYRGAVNPRCRLYELYFREHL